MDILSHFETICKYDDLTNIQSGKIVSKQQNFTRLSEDWIEQGLTSGPNTL